MIHLRKTSHLLSDHHLAGSTPQTTYSRDRARSRSIGPRLGDRSTRAERVDGHRGWGSAPGAPVRALWVKSLELGAFLKWSSHVWVYSVHLLGLHSSFGCPSRPMSRGRWPWPWPSCAVARCPAATRSLKRSYSAWVAGFCSSAHGENLTLFRGPEGCVVPCYLGYGTGTGTEMRLVFLLLLSPG